MIINFIHPSLKPFIECSTIASEGYEVQNLTSSNAALIQKGFLAERFISGPVLVTVKFMCPIDIHYVAIWSKVSLQKSLGFELSSLQKSEAYENEFQRFATVVMDSNPNGVIFHREGHKVNLNNPDIQLFHQRTFFRGRNNENVIELKIKIFKFQYVAAVKKIEVWGEPSRSCAYKLRKDVWNLWSSSQEKITNFPQSHVRSQPQKEMTVVSSSAITDADQVPDEFLDEITNEIMKLPMILPSGKVVDYQTLEKHQIEETKWGRTPNDPFTGVPFSETNKPVIAIPLKARLDEFLSKQSNTNNVKVLPRRLGSEKRKAVDFVVSKLVDENSKKRKSNSGEAEELPHRRETFEKYVYTETSVGYLRSYLKTPDPVERDNVVCTKCSSLNKNQLYKLLCSHIICKECVIRSENKCSSCQKNFNYSDIEKIHIPSGYECL